MSLPKMDGMEVLEALKADPATEQIPVIALTAQAMKGDRQRMIEAGCSDYISKPIEPDLVKKTIAKWFPQENR
jgi:CheY-like chemotaxis protein